MTQPYLPVPGLPHCWLHWRQSAGWWRCSSRHRGQSGCGRRGELVEKTADRWAAACGGRSGYRWPSWPEVRSGTTWSRVWADPLPCSLVLRARCGLRTGLRGARRYEGRSVSRRQTLLFNTHNTKCCKQWRRRGEGEGKGAITHSPPPKFWAVGTCRKIYFLYENFRQNIQNMRLKPTFTRNFRGKIEMLNLHIISSVYWMSKFAYKLTYAVQMKHRDSNFKLCQKFSQKYGTSSPKFYTF